MGKKKNKHNTNTSNNVENKEKKKEQVGNYYLFYKLVNSKDMWMVLYRRPKHVVKGHYLRFFSEKEHKRLIIVEINVSKNSSKKNNNTNEIIDEKFTFVKRLYTPVEVEYMKTNREFPEGSYRVSRTYRMDPYKWSKEVGQYLFQTQWEPMKVAKALF